MPISLRNRLAQQDADLRSEARTILTTAEREDRNLTDAERTRLDAINAELETVAADLRREEQASAALLSASPPPAGGGVVQRIHDRAADKPWGWDYGARLIQRADGTQMYGGARAAEAVALGEFLSAVHAARFGQVDPRLVPEAAALGGSEAVAADGGFLLAPELQNDIRLRMTAGEVLRRLTVHPMGSGLNSVEINMIDETSRATGSRFGGVQGYWVDEGGAITASRPKLHKITVKPRKVAALGYATDEEMQDIPLFGSIMQEAFGEELRFQTEDAVVEGTGVGKPLGILNAPCLITVAKETGQGAQTIENANLIKMWARLDARSRANAVWFINQDAEPQLDQLVLPAGTGGLEPRYVTYGPDGVLRIKGRPVVAIEYAATLGTAGDIILADLTQYLAVDRGGPQQASSMHVAFTTDEMAFRVTYRIDGQPKWRTALTPFKGTATVSPFVALATRA